MSWWTALQLIVALGLTISLGLLAGMGFVWLGGTLFRGIEQATGHQYFPTSDGSPGWWGGKVAPGRLTWRAWVAIGLTCLVPVILLMWFAAWRGKKVLSA